MITAKQIRAARALLGWSQNKLADRAILSASTVRYIENGRVDPRSSTLTAIRAALEKGGVELLPGEGVRPRPEPAPARTKGRR
jgi:transcriptional regulator with XRE-family HTH domain